MNPDNCLITKTFDWNEPLIAWAYSENQKAIKLPFMLVHAAVSNLDIFIQLTRIHWKSR